MILRVRDENGNFIPINAIKGDSAYEQAVLGGYKGTEAEFIALLNGLTSTEDATHYSNFSNPHKVTASQAGALPIEGGTLTGQVLFLNDGMGRVQCGNSFFQIDVFDEAKDGNNRRKLVLNGKNSGEAFADSLVLVSVENGEQTVSKIFGEHNKPTAADVGAIPTKYSVSTDLNTELQAGGTKMSVSSYNSSTKNTPYSAGLTVYAHGMVITNAHTETYGVQLCMPSGDSHIYIRKKDGAGISGWEKVCNTGDIPTMPKVSQKLTYTGTGTTGQENPCTLTFEAPPKMVVISDHIASYIGFFIRDVNQFIVFSSNGIMSSGANVTWAGNKLTWYMANGGQYYQLNGGTWKYSAVGIF